MSKKLILWTLFYFSVTALLAQNAILKKNKVSFGFQNYSDLIVVKVNLNGYENLNFILDTGSNSIIVFDDVYFSPKQKSNATDIKIRGLGSQGFLGAKLIRNNDLELHKKFKLNNINLYYIHQNSFSLGAKFGTEIHGIIGNNAFRKFKLEIKYASKRIIVHNKLQKTKKYNSTQLFLKNDKPFIQLRNANDYTYSLLMDSGGVDAIWLFDNDIDWNKEPYIRDFLGFGLSGEVLGNRVKKDSLKFEDYWFNKVYIAVPDSIYTKHVKEMYEKRDGSVGAQFMKKFDWIIDYRAKKLYYKPNSNFKKEFSYNALGFEVFQPIESIKFYIVESVLKGSAADKAGLYADDIIISINGIPSKDLSLDQIYKILKNFKVKKMTITIDRNGQKYYYKIPVRDILNGE